MSICQPLDQGEEEPDTSTASDDSGNGPWTVVTSPTHKRASSVEASSRPSPVLEEPAKSDKEAGQTKVSICKVSHAWCSETAVYCGSLLRGQ